MLSPDSESSDWNKRRIKREAHKLIIEELSVVTGAFLRNRNARVLGLPADNPEVAIGETEDLIGDSDWSYVGIEQDPSVYRKLQDTDPVRAGRMSVRRSKLRHVLRSQPRDGNLAYLDGDFCSTWLEVPTEDIKSLFNGTFVRSGGAMSITVRGSCPDIPRGESWDRGFSLARYIAEEQSLSCLFVPLAYPHGYKNDPESGTYRPKNGHLMLRFGYAWFPSENPSVCISSPEGQDFGLFQMGSGEPISKINHASRQSVRRFFVSST